MLAHYGLIGYPLQHSFSPAYFKKKFAAANIEAVYELYPIETIEAFPALLANNPDLKGLNVTTPYKEVVMPYLDEIDAVAAEIGAVNCIVIKNGRTKGYNTDATGFEKSLNPLLMPQHTAGALIIGTGGSSKAVGYALTQLGIPFHKVSRHKTDHVFSYRELNSDVMSYYKLIINTTPIGMYPHIDEAPQLPFEYIGEHHLLFDLIYNPEETKFLAMGRERGATTKNGFEMLQLQAEASWDIWNHVPETEASE